MTIRHVLVLLVLCGIVWWAYRVHDLNERKWQALVVKQDMDDPSFDPYGRKTIP